MCEHKWIPFIIEPIYASWSDGRGGTKRCNTGKFVTKKIICAECLEVREICESQYDLAMKSIKEYNEQHSS